MRRWNPTNYQRDLMRDLASNRTHYIILETGFGRRGWMQSEYENQYDVSPRAIDCLYNRGVLVVVQRIEGTLDFFPGDERVNRTKYERVDFRLSPVGMQWVESWQRKARAAVGLPSLTEK